MWQISNRHCGHGIADAIFGVPSKVISKQRLSALPGYVKSSRKERKCDLHRLYFKVLWGRRQCAQPKSQFTLKVKKCKIQKQFVNFKTTQIYSIPYIILELRCNTFFGFCSFKTYQTIRDLVKMGAICVINAGRSL